MKRRLIVAAVIVLIAAVTTVSVINSRTKKVQKVETARVELADLSREISTNGEIGSKRHGSVVATTSGTVTELVADVGDHVEAGAVIARLDPAGPEVSRKATQTALENARMAVRTEIMGLRTAYTQALTGFDQAVRDLARIQELHKIGSASSEELQRAKDTQAIASESLQSARQKLNLREGRPIDDPQTSPPRTDEAIVEGSLEVRQALANLESAERSVGETVLRATIGGTVTDLSIQKGGFVTVGTPVAAVHDTRALEITANIDEVDLPYIRVGQSVKVESDSFIGSEIGAQVTRIAPIIRRIGDSRVCEIKADIVRDEKGLARVGASCSIFITVEDKKGVPAIPVESYLLEGKKKHVFKVVPSETDGTLTVAKTEIQTGIMGLDKVEVVSGLAQGDEIVSTNLGVLKDGLQVERAETEGPKGGSGS